MVRGGGSSRVPVGGEITGESTGALAPGGGREGRGPVLVPEDRGLVLENASGSRGLGLVRGLTSTRNTERGREANHDLKTTNKDVNICKKNL